MARNIEIKAYVANLSATTARAASLAEVGVREAEDLMARLQVQPSHLIDRAYVDLLAERGSL